MADAKKDNRGRRLYKNEDQLSNGRYRYRYTDPNGERKDVYSWKLIPSDKIPPGKREDISLREKIKKIQKDLEDGIRTYDGTKPVNELIARYIDIKNNLSNSTKNNYIHMWEKNIKNNPLGMMSIISVKKSDILKFYTYLYKDRDFSSGTIQLYQNLLFPAFQLAVDDDIIRKNPCTNCMKDIKEKIKVERKVLTSQEQRILLNFVKTNGFFQRLFPIIYFLLSSGCRIGEAVGLTWNDINFTEKTVTIDHQLLYKKKNGKSQWYSDPPKNRRIRIIPLQDDIIRVLKKHKENTYFMSKLNGIEIDGYKEFVFISNSTYKPMQPSVINKAFHSIVEAYNKEEEDKAYFEEREPNFLPFFTPHELRHTFCTRMADNGIDVKVLQTIMGHANITTTMEVYRHMSDNKLHEEIEKMPEISSL